MVLALNESWLYLSALRVRLLARPGASVSVRSNRLRGQATTEPLVEVSQVASCLFDLNDGELAPGTEQRPIEVGRINGLHVGASNNRLIGLNNDFPALQLDSNIFTVLGNLTRGRILVGGAALPPPWDTLNVQL